MVFKSASFLAMYDIVPIPFKALHSSFLAFFLCLRSLDLVYKLYQTCSSLPVGCYHSSLNRQINLNTLLSLGVNRSVKLPSLTFVGV